MFCPPLVVGALPASGAAVVALVNLFGAFVAVYWTILRIEGKKLEEEPNKKIREILLFYNAPLEPMCISVV